MGDMEWVDLAYDKERWRAVVNEAANIIIPFNAADFLTS